MERKLTSMLGTAQFTYRISKKELARSTYIGVWSRCSHFTTQLMAIFPVRVKMQTKKITEKRVTCIFQGPGEPSKTHCVTVDVLTYSRFPACGEKTDNGKSLHY